MPEPRRDSGTSRGRGCSAKSSVLAVRSLPALERGAGCVVVAGAFVRGVCCRLRQQSGTAFPSKVHVMADARMTEIINLGTPKFEPGTTAGPRYERAAMHGTGYL